MRSRPLVCLISPAGCPASGTTGMPKASVMTHYRWLRALGGFGVIGMRLNSDVVLYCCLPLYHNNALTVAVSSVLSAGATLP
jgi:fatty-acyl-CoA synthase